MIGLILGTSEGKEILAKLNEFTDEIVVSTATKYGGELLNGYKIRKINWEPLDENGFKALIEYNNLKTIIDASHPYASQVSKILMKVCKEKKISYIRYERKSYFDEIEMEENIKRIDSYEELKAVLENVDGNILNTTGSNNIERIMNLNIKNRIIHRILPSVSILKKLIDIGIKIENIIAIKGPFGIDINNGIIKEYNIKALITKDSGIEGGTKEKVESALNNQVKIIVINKPKINYGETLDELEEVIKYIKDKKERLI